MQFTGQLYPFQETVLSWTQKTEKGIIGLDMGLGKTVITIAMICRKNYQRTLVVLPLQITEQWKASVLKFTKLTEKDVCVYQGRNRKSIDLSKYRVVITTYDVLRFELANQESILSQSKHLFDCMILDEAHKIRNKKTQTYNSCYEFGKIIVAKWLLTGTTIHNKFGDFYQLCEFLQLPDLSMNVFADPIQMKVFLDKYYIRLTKSNCHLKLPEKSIHEHFLNFEDDETHHDSYIELYTETKDIYEDYISHPTQLNFTCLLSKILRLRQCCNHIDATLDNKHYQLGKNRHDNMSSAKFEKIINIVNRTPLNDKLIVFSQWEHSLELLTQRLGKSGISYLMYNGSQSINERNSTLCTFRDGNAKVLLVTLTSGGVGLDMTFANHVILLDSWWNQALEDQAIDRVYRIGQKKSVEVHRLYMNDTIEKWIIEMKKEKKQIDLQFHNESVLFRPHKQMLKELLHRYISAEWLFMGDENKTEEEEEDEDENEN